LVKFQGISYNLLSFGIFFRFLVCRTEKNLATLAGGNNNKKLVEFYGNALALLFAVVNVATR
jgi:hypothetical protein